MIVTSSTAFLLLYTRSAGVFYFAAGATACAYTSKLVKRLIRQPRPKHPSAKQKSYGMPSTHSATITHYAVYIPLACLYLPIHPSFPNSPLTRYLPLLVVPYAAEIVGSRIWLGHHTWQQCAAGVLYGSVFALVWFKLWVSGLNVYGQAVEQQLNRLIFG